jgi:hypothetical protein
MKKRGRKKRGEREEEESEEEERGRIEELEGGRGEQKEKEWRRRMKRGEGVY